MAVRPVALRQLDSFLQKHEIADEVAKYMTDPPTTGLGLESISMFAGYLTASDYEAECRDVILTHVASHKDDRRQLAKLRVAWTFAVAEVNSIVKKKVEGAEEEVDIEAPLDEILKKKLESDFATAYSYRLTSDFEPTDAPFARVYREFKKKSIMVYALGKVRSASQVSFSRPVKHRKLTSNISLAIHDRDGGQETPDIQFSDPLVVLWSLKILCVAWAKAGTHEVQSKLTPGEMVRECSLSDAYGYHDFCMMKIMSFVGSTEETIRWFLDRDRHTRVKARDLFSQGWPWGEALRESREKHCSVLWTVAAGDAVQAILDTKSEHQLGTSEGISKVNSYALSFGRRSNNRPRPIKGNRQPQGGKGNKSGKGGNNKGGQQGKGVKNFVNNPCIEFNEGRCNSKQCPHGKVHRCIQRKADGSICGSPAHGRTSCPHRR